MSTTMTIQLANEYDLVFDVYNDEIARLWLGRMHQRHSWHLDDARRFYGFGSVQEQRQDAERRLKQDIEIINQYQYIIYRPWTSIDDQDLLNYLHHVFETYHGLLDQQKHDWWQRAPEPVRQALARLNIDVHRAESIARGAEPRFVCTWYGQPKTQKFTPEQMSTHGRLCVDWGGVYINYVEIGKTLQDLSIDNDQYISDDAFRPFLHYSSDFVVRFYNRKPDLTAINKYFNRNRDFFLKHGIDSVTHPFAMPYQYKVAQLRIDEPDCILRAIETRQHITDITIHETS